MAKFHTLVYNNIVRNNAQLDNWTQYVENLSFSTAANAGFAECSFTLKVPFSMARVLVMGQTNAPSFVTNRVLITDQQDNTVYEGMIHTMTLRYSGATLGASIDNLYTASRVTYAQTDTGLSYFTVSTQNTALWGVKVFTMDTNAAFTSATTPRIVGNRHVAQHSFPSKPDSKQLGGSGNEIVLEVSCVGFAATLGFRYAYNASGGGQDTFSIVQDMITGGAASGNNSGTGNDGWVERLVSSDDHTKGDGGNIPYRAQWIGTSVNGTSTGVSVPPFALSSSGQTRQEIIQQALSYGNSSGYRLLFQVWEGKNSGKGQAGVYVQSQVKGGVRGYAGYYDDSGEVFDSNHDRVNLWNVRAGQWITSLDLEASDVTYGGTDRTSPFQDPRAFWIEHTTYDAERGTLTLATTNEFNIALYLGRVVNGVRVIGESQ